MTPPDTGQQVMTSSFPVGGGDMGARIRAHDWTRFGAPQDWPEGLRTLVDLILNARQPMFVVWGDDLRFIYNDEYAPILGKKHPSALGRPFADVWSDIWPQILPMVSDTLAGNGSYYHNVLIPMQRHGYLEEAWFDFSYTPVRDAGGRICGLYCVARETTQEVLAQRRIADEHQRLSVMFDQAPGFMAVLSGPGHRFDLVNRAYTRLIGGRSVVGRTVRDALPETGDQGYVGQLDQVYRSGQPIVARGASYRFQADPETAPLERIVDFVFQPLFDSAGDVNGIFVQGADVTDHARAEADLVAARAAAELQAAEQAAILAHLAEGVIVADRAGRITFVNEAAKALHGVARLDVTPDDYSDVYHLFTEDGRPFPSADLPLSRAVRGEDVPETRWRIRRPDGSEVLAIGSARPILSGGAQVGAVLTLRDDTERVAAMQAVTENEARLRTLTDNLPAGIVYQMTTGPAGEDRRFMFVSQSVEKLTGVAAEVLTADAAVAYDLLLPKYRAAVIEAEGAALRDGRPLDMEVQFIRKDGALRWCRMIASPRMQPDGSLIWDGIQIDTTAQKEAEDSLRLMIDELNHRVKNTLSTVLSIAAQTFRPGMDTDRARADFTARILALARAHDVLTATNWTGTDVREIVRRGLECHDISGRVHIDGPHVTMPPRASLALSMALHELATNAARYGALSVDTGQVDIRWSVEGAAPDRRLTLHWTETGGPPPVPPESPGFGVRLIEYALAGELNGEVRVAFPPTGAVCVIDAPLPAES